MSVGVTFIAATLVRVWFPRAWREAGSLTSAFYAGDAQTFVDYAAHLVAGRAFDHDVPFHPPGWPFVLSLWFRAMGFSPMTGQPVDPSAVKLFVGTISGASVALAALLAGRLAGPGAMFGAALLGTFHFGHVVQGTVPTSEALYGLLVVVSLLLALRWVEMGAASFGSLLGAIAGFATLVRAEFALCAAGLGVLRAVAGPARLRRASLIAYASVYVLVLVPTTVWHWRSIDAFNRAHADRLPSTLPRFAPVTSYGAFNFAMANHSEAEGGPNRDHPLLGPDTAEDRTGLLDLARPDVNMLYVNGYSIGLAWMLQNPGAAIALWAKKAAITSGAFALGYLQDDLAAGVDGTRRRVDQFDPERRWMWPVHVALAVCGGVIIWRRSVARLLLAAPLLALAASVLLFYGYVRLGVAYLPVIWVLQGAALAALSRRIVPAGRAHRWAPALVVTAVVALLAIEVTGRSRARSLAVDGPRGPDGLVIADETVQIRRGH